MPLFIAVSRGNGDSVPRLGTGRRAGAAPENALLPALCQISEESTNVPAAHQPIIGTARIGAWLAPVLGFSHGLTL